jgi:hypothetical protein
MVSGLWEQPWELSSVVRELINAIDGQVGGFELASLFFGNAEDLYV